MSREAASRILKPAPLRFPVNSGRGGTMEPNSRIKAILPEMSEGGKKVAREDIFSEV